MRALAIAARCRSPPEISAGRWFFRSASPTRSRSVSARFLFSAVRASFGKCRYEDVFENRTLGKQVVFLKDETDLPVANRGKPRDSSSFPRSTSSRSTRPVVGGDPVCRECSAACSCPEPLGSDDGKTLLASQLKRNVAQNGQGAVSRGKLLGNVFGDECHGRSLRVIFRSSRSLWRSRFSNPHVG